MSRTAALALAAVTAAGLAVRAIPLALSDFPINDGGLFVAMTRAIQDAGWALPSTLAWNGTGLPFIYPPLAFYVAGLLESVLGLDLLDVFRWLPLLASALVVPAVFLLARELLRSDVGGLVAALAYALAPVSWVWLIQGGGATRSPGMLLAVLTLWQLLLLVRAPSRPRAVTVGLLAGLTALVHPGAAVFTAISGGLLWAFEGRTRLSLAAAAAAAGIGVVVAVPWLFVVLDRHGLASLLAVPSNGPEPVAAVLALFAGRVTGTPFTDPLAIIGLALAIHGLIRRRFLLPIWFGVSLFLSYQYAMIPFGILVGQGALDLAALRTANRERDGAPADTDARIGRWIAAVGFAVLACALAVEAAASALTVYNAAAPVHALSADRRDAMAWVSSELEPDSRVAVVTYHGWSTDPDSEWFPLLAGRRSVATVQGSELLGTAAFAAQVTAHLSMQQCVQESSVECIVEFLDDWPAEYLFLPQGRLSGPTSPEDCCPELRNALAADDRFDTAYDGAGATVFGVRDPALLAGLR